MKIQLRNVPTVFITNLQLIMHIIYILMSASVINGVLEMDGFRMTLGFSRNSSDAQCEQGDEGTILVHMHLTQCHACSHR